MRSSKLRCMMAGPLYRVLLTALVTMLLGACGSDDVSTGTNPPDATGVTDSGESVDDTSTDTTDTDTVETVGEDVDTGDADTGTQDTGDTVDTGDTEGQEDTTTDTGTGDAGTEDTDTGAEDTDTGAEDTGVEDTGEDTGEEPCGGPCDDENPCTVDKCSALTDECEFIAVPLPCEDGDPCTVGDVCDDAGACQSGAGAAVCDDGNPCTEGTCVTLVGCEFSAINEGQACDDNNTCTTGEACTAGSCEGGALPDCDDSDACTTDACENGVGCVSVVEPAFCDDSNGCTIDTCDSVTGCLYEAVADGTACDDGDPCTGGDLCASGECQSGLEPNECDDGNVCTADSCVPGEGCQHLQETDGLACDDLVEATIEDQCKAGVCKGVADDCAALLGLDLPTMKVFSMFVLTTQSDALDIDGDGEPDNAIGPIGEFINPELKSALDDGSVIYVAHWGDLSESNPFDVSFFLGQLAPANPACAFQSTACDYLVLPEGFDEECTALSTFPSVGWNGKKLSSAETGTFNLTFAFSGGIFEIAMHLAQVQIDVQLNDTQVTFFNGKVGGAVVKSELVALADLIPSPLPTPLGDLVDILIQPDIDIDGDGDNEGVSVTLLVSGGGGNIVGVVKE